MPYIIAAIVAVVGLILFFVFRTPVEAPSVVDTPTETPSEITVEAPEVYPEPEIPVDTIAIPDPDIVESIAAGMIYKAEADYLTPRRTNHDIEVSLTIENNIVTDANVMYDGGPAGTPAHIGFDNAYAEAVIGQNINEVELSRVGGASLTSDAFNDAVADIRTQMQS